MANGTDRYYCTSEDVRALLRVRYSHPEWATCFEVANATGTNARRYADAVAMNLFPSRGLALHGFEIKTSKSDFTNEVRNPDKSVAVQQYCDHWWVVAPAHAMDEALLPVTWGWLRVDRGKLVQVRAAPKLDAKPITRAFMAALVRRANEVDASEVSAKARLEVEKMRAQDQQRIDAEVKRRSAKADEAIKLLADLKAKIGEDDWRYLGVDEVARAVKYVRRCGVAGSYAGIDSLRRTLESMIKRIAEADVVVNGATGGVASVDEAA